MLIPQRLDVTGDGGSLEVEVPEGFVFEVSIPWYLHWLLDPHDDRFLRAAAFHDYALHKLGWPRELAAAPFGLALREDEVGEWTRLAMVLAVIVRKWN